MSSFGKAGRGVAWGLIDGSNSASPTRLRTRSIFHAVLPTFSLRHMSAASPVRGLR